jgi:tetratricopeptide (TPR) repeat protein
MAFVLRSMGRQEEAGPLIDRVLEVRNRVLGPEHPHTLDTMESAAYCSLAMGRLAEARARFERVLEVRRRVLGPEHPDTIALAAMIAHTLAAQGEWKPALALYEQVLAAQPDHYAARFDLALIRLQLGDQAGYRRHCAWLIQKTSSSDAPLLADRAAKTAVLCPDAVHNPSRTLEVARRALEEHSGNVQLRPAVAAALYRAGHFAEAVAQFQEIRHRITDEPLRVEVELFLAMSYWRLNRHEDARRSLAEARRRVTAHERSIDARGQPGAFWVDWTRCKILHNEAGALVGAVPGREVPTLDTAIGRREE